MRALCLALALALSGCMTTALQTASGGAWHEVRTPRFVAWTDSDPVQAAALLRDLERFHRVALKTTSAQEREGVPPLQILIARDPNTFRAWTGQNTAVVAGLFKATMLGTLAFVSAQASDKDGELSSRHILFHEYTHYLMASSGARVPSWYNEGFAEYLGATELDEAGAYRLGCPPRYRTRWTEYVKWLPMAQVMDAPNVATLATGPHIGHRGRATSDPYAQSWYAVHYFNQDAARRQQLARYLELTGRGTPSAAAAETAFGMDYGALDAALRAHAEQKSFPCVELTPAQAESVPEPEVRAITEAEAYYRVGHMLLASFGDLDSAREALEQALARQRRHAKAHASLGRVHLRLAENSFRDNADPKPEIERATKYLKDARAIDPSLAEAFAIEGHLHYLQIEMAIARKDEAGTRSALAAARSAYRKAVQLDATLAEALLGIGLTYVLQDDGAEEGQVALEGAAYLLPLDVSAAVGLSKLHIARKQLELAIPPLEHIVRWSQSEEQRAQARALIDQIRSTLAARPLGVRPG